MYKCSYFSRKDFIRFFIFFLRHSLYTQSSIPINGLIHQQSIFIQFQMDMLFPVLVLCFLHDLAKTHNNTQAQIIFRLQGIQIQGS